MYQHCIAEGFLGRSWIKCSELHIFQPTEARYTPWRKARGLRCWARRPLPAQWWAFLTTNLVRFVAYKCSPGVDCRALSPFQVISVVVPLCQRLIVARLKRITRNSCLLWWPNSTWLKESCQVCDRPLNTNVYLAAVFQNWCRVSMHFLEPVQSKWNFNCNWWKYCNLHFCFETCK